MAHCIPTYFMAAGLLGLGMNWWQALLTILLGNSIVLVPILLNAHAGTRYGIPFPVVARASFGTRGANVAALLRAIVACGWFGIQCAIGGDAIRTFLVALWPAFGTIGGDTTIAGLSISRAITFAIFWLLNIWIIYRGMNAVRVFENWAAPIVLVLAAWLVWWTVDRAGGMGPIFEQPSKFEGLADFWPVFVPALTGIIGFWATLSLNIPDFTRFGKSQREQMLGQTLGLPTTMVLFSAMGVVVTSAAHAVFTGVDAAKLWDPVFILERITAGPGADGSAPLIESALTRTLVAIIALLGVGIATLSVNIAANVVSPANDFANLAPKRISFQTGGLITGILGVLMMPWKLLDNPTSYIFEWLIGYSALLGPIAGIMIVDYWWLRRRQLDVHDLYRVNGSVAGVNTSALIALVLGIAPNVPGFLAQAHVVELGSGFWTTLYTYAWFVGFAVAGLVYVALETPRRRAVRA
jgi:NCS1 family nucleobase:cation symporter-1